MSVIEIALKSINGKDVPAVVADGVKDGRHIRVTIEKCSHGFNERNFAPVEYTDAKGETSTMFMGVHHV